MAALDQQQVDAYRRDGYLCPVEVLSPEEAARHRAVLQGQEADFGKDGLPRPIGQYHRVNAHLVSEMACATALDSRTPTLSPMTTCCRAVRRSPSRLTRAMPM